MTSVPHPIDLPENRALSMSQTSYHAYRVLQFAFIVAPIIAGLDKFFHVLVNWDMYLAPAMANLSPIGRHGFMLVVGIIEIVAGIIVVLNLKLLADMLFG